MDARHVRQLAKELMVTNQERQEILRILTDDDYTAPFPLIGPVTFGKVLLLIYIIEDSSLSLETTLPIAIPLIDEVDGPIVTVNLKRSCLRRLNSNEDLHQTIDHLYISKDNSLGPFCDQLKINKKWLQDAHQQTVEPDATICNGVILELFTHLKTPAHAKNWTVAQRWMTRLYPHYDAPRTQTLSSDWARLQKKRSKLVAKRKKDSFLAEEYKFPMTACSETTNDASSEELPSEANADIFHAEYDSPIKQKLVKHICSQDELISKLSTQLEEQQHQLSTIKAEYGELLDNDEDNIKDHNTTIHKLETLQKREEDLQARMKSIMEEYNPLKVKKQLQYREKTMAELRETVSAYKLDLEAERRRIERMEDDIKSEKHKKRKAQKRVCYYKSKARPLEDMKDEEINDLLKQEKQLRYEVDDLQCQLDECMADKYIKTFENGRYIDAIRLVCYDFLSRNVGTQHVSPLIRSVLEKMAGIQVDRLPKATLVKFMALEADILARKQAARALLTSENATLHTDATSKKDRHYYSFQISTPSGNFSAGLMESVGGDTATQIDITKGFLTDLATLISPEDVDKDSRPTEYQLLFNIKNTMTDRGPTSKGWVQGLELWRETIIRENVMPNFKDLSDDAIRKLSTINDFYCGKHFLLGLADRTKVGLSLWEDEISDLTGRIGMEKLPQFEKWNCQKPSGLRLVRTACELVGPGAKAPHGIPSLFDDVLSEGERNFIPTFEHNRFNIIFKASSAVYHHHIKLKQLLLDVGSENKLHKAVIADIDSVVTLAEVRAIGLLEKHVTTPLHNITSKKEHILDLRRYYARLKDFLTEIVSNPKPILDGSAVLYEDAPPIKDVIWDSLYAHVSEEQDALVEQVVAVLCASFLVTLERQLFDFVSGKWSEQSNELRLESATVPRNNDISERDFSGLDRLLRVKVTAKLDFIRGLLLFTNNKTAAALREMTSRDLHSELSSAIKLARESLKTSRYRQAELQRQRLAALEDKKKKREALEQSRLRAARKALDDVSIDGQQMDPAGVEAMLSKYVTAKEKKDAIKRQLNYYKTLKIKSVPHQKYNMTCAGKEHSVEILTENLIFVIQVWSGIFNSDSAASNSSPSTPSVPNLTGHKDRICHLKRRLMDEASSERNKKVKKSAPQAPFPTPFPGDDIIGKEIKHKYEVKTRTGNITKKWYRGTVLRKANEEELVDASPEDLITVEQGHTIFMVLYEKHENAEPIGLQADWENGDIKLV